MPFFTEVEIDEATKQGCQAIFAAFPNWRDQPLVELVRAALVSQLSPKQREPITSWMLGESRTSRGELVRFGAAKQDVPLVTEAIERLVDIDLPDTHQYSIGHGSFGAYSRYRLEQLKYAGGGSGYIEVLHVNDAPDGRCPNVVYLYSMYGGCWFWEFPNRTTAVAAWKACWGHGNRIFGAMSQQKGLVRAVFCDTLRPWFYAVGNQVICGDLVFPAYQQDHPYFVPGGYYLVDSEEPGEQKVKRCIGSRIQYDGYGGRQYVKQAVVFWDDGTVSEFSDRLHDMPRALGDDEDIAFTLGEFRRLLGEDPNAAIDVVNALRQRARTNSFRESRE
jgi:hypothetical protein